MPVRWEFVYIISNLRSIKHPNVITVTNLAQIYIPIIGMAGTFIIIII